MKSEYNLGSCTAISHGHHINHIMGMLNLLRPRPLATKATHIFSHIQSTNRVVLYKSVVNVVASGRANLPYI